MTIRAVRGAVVALAAAMALPGARAQVAAFDAAAGLLKIPSVNVGSATYVDVRLAHLGDYVFALQAATEQRPVSGSGTTTYDAASGLVTIPAVKVGSETYVDVTLGLTPEGRFALRGATAVPAATLDELKAAMAALDALWADDVPATGAQLTSLTDACYRGGGRTKAYLIAEFDADREQLRRRDAYRVGAQRVDLQLLALRSLRNADGSTRREADVQFDVVYRDGSRAVAATETLVSGSTAGTPGCDASQSGPGWRFFGNQRLVGFVMQSRALRDERYALANGAAASPLVRYRRDVRVQVSDPMARATYVVVSGPGPGATVNGVPVPWSWKMLSPAVLRAAPEMAGRPGHFVNWDNDDSFRYCGVAGTGTPVAAQADCQAYGATNDNWGIGYTGTPNAAADEQFAAQGWVAGGVYRLDVYDDDGWKRVNGHAGRTPIASYYETLSALPRSFVEMAGSGPTQDRFARLDLGTAGPAGVLENTRRSVPAPIAVSWNALPGPADGTAFRLFQAWEYFEGTKIGVPAGASWPRLREQGLQFPGAAATAIGAWPVMGLPPELSARTYLEYTLWFSDRNAGVIQSRISFQ
ncbi:MAG: hypothetical protein U1F56_08445 [Rubrivivax sp.]